MNHMNFIDHISNSVRTLNAKGRRNALKILTLSVGLSVGLVLTCKVCFEQTFDDFYNDVDRIYCLNMSATVNGTYRVFSSVPGGIAPKMKEYFPQIEDATRMTGLGADRVTLVLSETGSRLKAADPVLADSSYFRILNSDCLAGDLVAPLAIKGQVLVSSKIASRMAAALSSGEKMDERAAASLALGQKLTLADFTNKYELTVAGVYEEAPLNASFRPEMVIAMPTIDQYIWDGSENLVGNERYKAFLKLKKGADAGEVDSAVPEFMEKYLPMDMIREAGFDMGFQTSPLTDFHSKDETGRNMTLVLALVAFALIVTSMLNYLLIVLSSAVTRSREMALRKCLGSGRGEIFGMMLAESLVHTALAAVIGAVLIFAFQSQIETILGVEISALFTGKPLVLMLSVLAVIVLLNSAVPAAFFNRIPVAVAFRNYRSGRRLWKHVLLAVEFTAVVFLAVMMSILTLQYNKLTGEDLGYDYENVAVLEMPEATGSQKNALMAELRSLPDVDDASFSFQLPTSLYSGDNVSIPGEARQLFNIQDAYWVDDHFFNVLGIEIEEGANFNPSLEIDAEMIVDRKFVESMEKTAGWDGDIVGRELMVTSHELDGGSRICGVIDGIRTGSFAKEAEEYGARPMAIFYCNPEMYARLFNVILIRYHNITAEALKKTADAAEKTLPDQSYDLHPFSDRVSANYEETLKTRNAIVAGGLVTLLIALIGLVGYTVDEVRRRSREIAVRRVNGAQFSQIRSMFLKDIMFIALPSTLAGCILGGIAAAKWEQNFSLQVGLPWWVFLCSALAAILVISAISDAYVNLTAGRNPAESIKTE